MSRIHRPILMLVGGGVSRSAAGLDAVRAQGGWVTGTAPAVRVRSPADLDLDLKWEWLIGTGVGLV